MQKLKDPDSGEKEHKMARRPQDGKKMDEEVKDAPSGDEDHKAPAGTKRQKTVSEAAALAVEYAMGYMLQIKQCRTKEDE